MLGIGLGLGGSVVGCSDAGSPPGDPADAAVDGSVGADAGDTGGAPDTSAGDVATDTGPDASTDAASDTSSDASGDTGSDTGSDTSTDVAADGAPDAAPLVPASDEFSSASTLSSYGDLYPSRHSIFDIGVTTAGALTLAPTLALHTTWYSDDTGPLVYKTVGADFVVETAVTVTRVGSSAAPSGNFNQAGLVIRDPATTYPGNARWIMYNVGHQDGRIAREAKWTRPSGGGPSLSTLYLNDTPGGSLTVQLRVCRFGGTFHFFHRHPSEGALIEEQFVTASTRVSGNGAGAATPGVSGAGPLRFTVPMATGLQVGLLAGTWEAPHDVKGTFDYLRFGTVASFADCTKAL